MGWINDVHQQCYEGTMGGVEIKYSNDGLEFGNIGDGNGISRNFLLFNSAR